MTNLSDTIWHKLLKRPYILARPIDIGHGTPVVCLHGIGSSGLAWQRVCRQLGDIPCRVVAFDLLGFGSSPKPEWMQYTVEDHARSVIAGLERLHLREPIVLVGHSMGCLIAVHIARLRPDLVRQLIMYEIPLYEGLPESRRYRLRRDFYYRIYNRLLRYPEFSPTNIRTIQKLAARFAGFTISQESWTPFVRSLQHTILQQTSLADLKRLEVPTDIIYGSLDILVIRGNPKVVFGEEAAHISTRVITEVHGISARASRFLARRIAEVLGYELSPPVKPHRALESK